MANKYWLECGIAAHKEKGNLRMSTLSKALLFALVNGEFVDIGYPIATTIGGFIVQIYDDLDKDICEQLSIRPGGHLTFGKDEVERVLRGTAWQENYHLQ